MGLLVYEYKYSRDDTLPSVEPYYKSYSGPPFYVPIGCSVLTRNAKHTEQTYYPDQKHNDKRKTDCYYPPTHTETCIQIHTFKSSTLNISSLTFNNQQYTRGNEILQISLTPLLWLMQSVYIRILIWYINNILTWYVAKVEKRKIAYPGSLLIKPDIEYWKKCQKYGYIVILNKKCFHGA